MFMTRSAFFFQTDAPSLASQLDRFGIFDFSLLMNSLSCVAPLGWHHYFVTPWANSIEHEQKFEYLLSSLHDLSLDVETACLLTTVALFSSHGLQPQQLSVNIEELRETQYNFSLLLFRYLCHTRGRNEASRIYPSFVGVLEKLREMADILKNKTIKIWPTPTVEEYLDNFVLN